MCGLYRILDHHIIKKSALQLLILLLISQVENTWLPIVSYQRQQEYRISEISLVERAVAWNSPCFYYSAFVTAPIDSEETEEEEPQLADAVDDANRKESITISYMDEMVQENSRRKESEQEENPEETMEANMEENVSFQEQEIPCMMYDWSTRWTQDDLRAEFFAVDSSTSMKSEYLELDKLLNQDLTIKETGDDGPQILIYHTHASEAFLDSVEGDASTTIVGAGDRLASLLEGYGFRVLHHTGVYDSERDSAYDAALPAIEQILKENPSIQVVIDLHRDEMSGDRKLVMDLQGRPTARFMFFNGLSYSRKKGDIAYLENPYILDNLAFSFQAQVAANEYYPGIARKIYLKAYRYNMHLCSHSMLIELGAQNNTVEEIMNACDPLAHVLAIVLRKMV